MLLLIMLTDRSSSFAEGGKGCHHWCATALEKLGEGGYVDSQVGAYIRAWEEQEVNKWGSVRFPMPRIKGSFY